MRVLNWIRIITSFTHAKEQKTVVGNTENNHMYVYSTVILAELPFKIGQNENLDGFKFELILRKILKFPNFVNY